MSEITEVSQSTSDETTAAVDEGFQLGTDLDGVSMTGGPVAAPSTDNVVAPGIPAGQTSETQTDSDPSYLINTPREQLPPHYQMAQDAVRKHQSGADRAKGEEVARLNQRLAQAEGELNQMRSQPQQIAQAVQAGVQANQPAEDLYADIRAMLPEGAQDSPDVVDMIIERKLADRLGTSERQMGQLTQAIAQVVQQMHSGQAESYRQSYQEAQAEYGAENVGQFYAANKPSVDAMMKTRNPRTGQAFTPKEAIGMLGGFASNEGNSAQSNLDQARQDAQANAAGVPLMGARGAAIPAGTGELSQYDLLKAAERLGFGPAENPLQQ